MEHWTAEYANVSAQKWWVQEMSTDKAFYKKLNPMGYTTDIGPRSIRDDEDGNEHSTIILQAYKYLPQV